MKLSFISGFLLIFCTFFYVNVAQPNRVCDIERKAAFEAYKNARDEIKELRKQLEELAQEKIRTQQHWEALQTFYGTLNYNFSGPIVTGQIPVPDIFDPNVLGRVEPTAVTVDLEGIREYLYVVAGTQTIMFGETITPLTNEITRFYNNGSFALVDSMLRFYFNNGTLAINVTQTSEYRFVETENGSKIIEFVMHTPNLGYWWIAIGNDYRNPLFQAGARARICQIHEFFCVPNGYRQYANNTECMNTVNALPMGTPDQFADSSVSCYLYHGIAATKVPKHHCPHIGKPEFNQACKVRKYNDWIVPLFSAYPRIFN